MVGTEAIPRRRRVFVADRGELGPLAGPIAAWVTRLGHELVADPRSEGLTVDLEVRSALVEPVREGPVWVAVSARRVESARELALRRAGASDVLDGRHGLLDLAYAMAERLFENRAEQRRHGLLHGRLEVGLRSRTGASGQGRLVGLHRCGAWIEAPGVALGEGALVELDIEVEDRTARLRGRVVSDRYRRGQGSPLLAVELALDQGGELRSFRRLGRGPTRHGSRTGDVPSIA